MRCAVLWGALLTGVSLNASAQLGPSSRDSLVTVRHLTRACRILELRTGLVTAEQDSSRIAKEDSIRIKLDTSPTAKPDTAALNAARRAVGEARTRYEKVRNVVDANAANGIEWLCEFSDIRRVVAPDITIPSRTEVLRVAQESAKAFGENVALGGVAGFASFLGISEANVISGLTSFLITRAGDEIQIAFVEKVTTELCAPKVTFAPLFFNACAVLDQEHLKLRTAVLKELQSAIRSDFRLLPRTAPLSAIRNTTFWTAGSDAKRDAILAAYVLGNTATQLIDGHDPIAALTSVLSADADVIDGDSTPARGLLEDALAKSDTLPVAAALQRLALVGLILPDKDANGIGEWPDEDGRIEFVRTMIVNVNGWLEVELKVTNLGETNRVLNSVAALNRALFDSEQKINDLKKKLSAAAGADQSLAEYAGIIEAGLRVGEVWLDLTQHFSRDTSLARYVRGLRSGLTALASRDYSAAAVALYSLAESATGKTIGIPSTAAKALSFTTALAQAEDGETVEAVLHAYAAPVQSYRGKRKDRFYVALNGYLGMGGGWEISAGDTAKFLGVSAPIGVEIGIGSNKGWSLGAFGQVLDLGALGSFRITADDSELESEPKVGFAQVFSPGLYAVLGIRGVPLAIGGGWNYAPSLRKVSANPELTENASRWGFFLSIDMPLIRVR
jgi:hypothetical protein